MPCAHDAALQERECGFDGVGVYVAANVLASLVIDGFMLVFERSAHRAWIDRELVGNQYVYILANVVVDDLVKGGSFQIVCAKKAQLSATLPNADDDFFVARVRGAGSTSTPSPADIGFIHLYDTVEFGLGLRFCHSVTDAMTEIPRRPIVDPQHPLKLVCRHPFAGLANQKRSKKPFGEGQVGIVEDRASRHGELIAA